MRVLYLTFYFTFDVRTYDTIDVLFTFVGIQRTLKTNINIWHRKTIRNSILGIVSQTVQYLCSYEFVLPMLQRSLGRNCLQYLWLCFLNRIKSWITVGTLYFVTRNLFSYHVVLIFDGWLNFHLKIEWFVKVFRVQDYYMQELQCTKHTGRDLE